MEARLLIYEGAQSIISSDFTELCRAQVDRVDFSARSESFLNGFNTAEDQILAYLGHGLCCLWCGAEAIKEDRLERECRCESVDPDKIFLTFEDHNLLSTPVLLAFACNSSRVLGRKMVEQKLGEMFYFGFREALWVPPLPEAAALFQRYFSGLIDSAVDLVKEGNAQKIFSGLQKLKESIGDWGSCRVSTAFFYMAADSFELLGWNDGLEIGGTCAANPLLDQFEKTISTI